jgi:hypothetical protein
MHHLRILTTKGVKRNKFHTEDTQILCATIQNLVAWQLSALDLCINDLQDKLETETGRQNFGSNLRETCLIHLQYGHKILT